MRLAIHIFHSLKMLLFVLKIAMMAAIAICICTSIVQAQITANPNQRIPKKLNEDEGAILVVGDKSKLMISAKYQTPPKTVAICQMEIDDDLGTFESPCLIKTNEQQQSFRAQCLKTQGSAVIIFHKNDENGNKVEVEAGDGMWAGFTTKELLEQGTLNSTKKGVKVILNCNNNKSHN